MPYSSLKQAPGSFKTIGGVALTLSQVNSIASTYDALVAQGKSKSSAAAIAKDQFKNSHVKKDGRWVKKSNKEQTVDLGTTEELNDNLSCYISLQEAEFSDDKREAIVTIIREGWSLNYTDGRQRYYTKQAVESVSRLINEGSRKMYLDHSRDPNRSIRDWVATIREASVETENDATYARATIKFRITEDGKALYEDAKETPSEIGISIDGQGRMKAGKIAEKKAAIVEDVTRLYSSDFVTKAAAGGRVERIAASEEITAMDEAVKSIDQYLDDIKKREGPWIEYEWLWTALRHFFIDLMYDGQVEKNNLSKAIDKALKSFGGKIKVAISNIKFKEDFNSLDELLDAGYDKEDFTSEVIKIKEEDKEKEEFIWEATTKTEGGISYPASAYLLVPDNKKPSTWKLRYKEFEEGKLKLNKELMEELSTAILKKEKVLSTEQRASAIHKLKDAYRYLKVSEKEWPDGLKPKTKESKMHKNAKDFEQENPEVYQEMKEQIFLIAENDIKKDLGKKIEELEKQVKDLTDSKEKLEKENKTLTTDLEAYKVKEKEEERKGKVNKELKDAEIDDKVSDTFRESLYKEEDEEVRKAMITQVSEAFKSKTGQVDDNPQRPGPKDEKPVDAKKLVDKAFN